MTSSTNTLVHVDKMDGIGVCSGLPPAAGNGPDRVRGWSLELRFFFPLELPGNLTQSDPKRESREPFPSPLLLSLMSHYGFRPGF